MTEPPSFVMVCHTSADFCHQWLTPGTHSTAMPHPKANPKELTTMPLLPHPADNDLLPSPALAAGVLVLPALATRGRGPAAPCPAVAPPWARRAGWPHARAAPPAVLTAAPATAARCPPRMPRAACTAAAGRAAMPTAAWSRPAAPPPPVRPPATACRHKAATARAAA